MGIAWLGNVLLFREELLFIAYTMTAFFTGQGIIIFLLYVPMSNHVRKDFVRLNIIASTGKSSLS